MSCSTCNIAQHVAALHCADTEATAVSSASARHSAVDPHAHPYPHPHAHSHPLPRICSVASCRSASNIIIADASVMADAMLPSFAPNCAHVAGKLLAPPSLSTPRSASSSTPLPVSISSPSFVAAPVATPCLSISPSAPLLNREPTISTSLPEIALPFGDPTLPSLLPPPPQSPRTAPLQAPQPLQSPVKPKQQTGKSGKNWTAAVTIGVGSSLGVAAMAGVRFAGYGAQPSLFDLFSSLGVPLDIRMIEGCALSLWHLSSALSFPLPLPFPSLSSLDHNFNLLLLLLLTALCAAGAAFLLPPSTSAAGAASRGEGRNGRSARSGVGAEATGSAETAGQSGLAAETITSSVPAGAAGRSEGGWWWGSGWWWRVNVDATVSGAADGATDVLHEGLGSGIGGGTTAAAAAVAAAAAGRMTRKIANLSVEVPEAFFLSAPHQPSPSSASPRVSSPFFTASSPCFPSFERITLLHRAADAAAAAATATSAALLSPLAACSVTDAATADGAAPANADGAEAAATAAAAAAAEAFMKSDRGEVNSGDLADLMLHLDWSYDDGLGRWDRIIDRESDDVQYEAWRRDPKNGGPTEYHTLTRFPGMPARLVAAYYTDCTYHLQHQCDPVLKAFSPLSACPVTGVHKGRFERKYPLCAAREYVLAWKVWEMWGGCGAVRGGGGAGMEREEEKGEEGGVRGVEGGEVVFCVTKAIEDETVPRKSKPKRVDIYNCGWRVQDVVLSDGRKAAEIEMVVRDDCGIQRDMAKMAFRRGAWGYVCNTLAHIRGYVQLHPHLLLPPPAPPSAGFQALLGENSVQSQQEQEQQEQEEEEERGEEMDRVQQTVLLSKDGSSSNSSSRVVDQDGMFPTGDAAAAAAATGVGAQAEVSSSLAALSASTSGAREAGAALSRSLFAQASLPRLLRFTPRPGLSLSRAFSCLRSAAAATAAGIGSSRSFFAATPEPGSSAALSLAPASGPGGSGLGSAAAGASMARTSDGKRVLLLRGVVPVVAVAAMGLGVGGLLVVHCGAAGAASKVLLACTLRSMWVGAQRESPQEGPSQAGRKEARK
ncbi:unnamed protein product [Closterium sp. NIES-53]